MADLYDHAVAFLRAEGVDVEHELEMVESARQAEDARIRAKAETARNWAIAANAAERKLVFEAQGFSAGWPGFSSGKLNEAQQRFDAADAALYEACGNDRDLARHVRRQVA